MSATSPSVAHRQLSAAQLARQRLAGRIGNNCSQESIGEARAELDAINADADLIERAIRESVRGAPPLSDSQRAFLASVLASGIAESPC